MKHTPEAVAEALDYYRGQFMGRTRWKDRAQFHDEVLVAEIERLTAHHDALVTALEWAAERLEVDDGLTIKEQQTTASTLRAALDKVKPNG